DSLGRSDPSRHQLPRRRRLPQPLPLRLRRSSPAAPAARCPLLSLRGRRGSAAGAPFRAAQDRLPPQPLRRHDRLLPRPLRLQPRPLARPPAQPPRDRRFLGRRLRLQPHRRSPAAVRRFQPLPHLSQPQRQVGHRLRRDRRDRPLRLRNHLLCPDPALLSGEWEHHRGRCPPGIGERTPKLGRREGDGLGSEPWRRGPEPRFQGVRMGEVCVGRGAWWTTRDAVMAHCKDVRIGFGNGTVAAAGDLVGPSPKNCLVLM
ncbi:unnamed protein product, partial [Musa hybrid cultivar]